MLTQLLVGEIHWLIPVECSEETIGTDETRPMRVPPNCLIGERVII